MKNVTIKDIAKQLRISAATVSRALRDHPNISSERKESVWEVAVPHPPHHPGKHVKRRSRYLIRILLILAFEGPDTLTK
ncbi:MAG: LacI family DNA-binding transcriptional regulator [Fibrobacteria bacterium]